jgi:hypothetical protein
MSKHVVFCSDDVTFNCAAEADVANQTRENLETLKVTYSPAPGMVMSVLGQCLHTFHSASDFPSAPPRPRGWLDEHIFSKFLGSSV